MLGGTESDIGDDMVNRRFQALRKVLLWAEVVIVSFKEWINVL